jgi:hypothetical protein
MTTVNELTFEFNANYEAVNFDAALQPERALVGAFFVGATTDNGTHTVEKLSDAQVHANRERAAAYEQRRKERESKRTEALELRQRALKEGMSELRDAGGRREPGEEDEDDGDNDEEEKQAVDEDEDVDDKQPPKRRLMPRSEQVEEASEDKDA